ncbi:MAG TPA: prenyltransferase/squalene oxidase repeat-containing protein [Acidimicrobiales bacterium]|nr:prenyltransferase/squalene oxidase repeat-containing protein [Acidimicrobiales bacterium]
MQRRRIALAGTAISVALALVPLAPLPAGAADIRSEDTSARAVSFLISQQRPDGGFGQAEAGFEGFETPDVVLALAEVAQSSLVPDPARALATVRAVEEGGRTALDYLDDLADGGVNPGKAAQLVVVADVLGLSPTAFDPQGDGATDLLAVVDSGRNPDGSYDPFFGSTLQVVLAFAAVGRPVPADTIASIRAAQQDSGGYDFSGDPGAEGDDVDTTGKAIQALAAGGVPASDPSIADALARLAAIQNADGSWSAFGSPDPNATAQAILGIEAAGFSSVDDCWRTVAGASKPLATPDSFLRAAQVPDGRIASPNDEFGINSLATSQAVQALLRTMQPVVRADRAACPTTGYRLVAADGGVFSHGDATFEGSTGDRALNQPIVATAGTPGHRGYWLIAADGGVFSFGDAPFLGSTGDITLNSPIVAAAATPSGGGYWLFAADGGVFTFGDAAFLGSTGDRRLNAPIVAAMSTPSGRGYWLFAADGGVFTFGDASFVGSTGDRVLNRPVVSGASSRTGRGYWLFASDGGVFAFGDAAFAGSTGDRVLNQPVVTGVRSGGDGYYLVARDGGVFAFGAPFLGSEGARTLNSPIVGALA